MLTASIFACCPHTRKYVYYPNTKCTNSIFFMLEQFYCYVNKCYLKEPKINIYSSNLYTKANKNL